MKVAREKAAHYVQEKMTDDFSSETQRTTDSRTTFVKQRKKKKFINLNSISSESIFQFEDETKIFSL